MNYIYNNRVIIDLPFKVQAYDKRYKLLSEAQNTFYAEHPTATIWEIKNCKLQEPVEAITPSIEELKDEALKTISNYSLTTVNKYCTPYQFANAQASLMAIQDGGIGIYNEEDSQQYINLYIHYGKQCRDLYYEAKEYLELCNSEEEIINVINTYKEYYDNLSN